jgi:ParB-like nuclease domain
METGTDKAASGRSASLVSLLQGIDQRHRHPQNPARQERGVPEQPNRQIERAPLARLTPCKTNARTHSPKQVGRIAASIKRFGFIVPVLVNAENQIVAGHGRVEAAKLLGLPEVPVLRVSHLSSAEQRAFVIADNRLAELAEWDRDTLAIELEGLIELDFDVEVTGFDIGEIELILRDEEEDEGGKGKTGAGANTAKSTCGPAVSRRGDVWLLGAHRLDCADTDDAPDYAAVDAAIRCWQRFTGKSATLAGSGRTFNAIAKERRKRPAAGHASGSSAVQPAPEAA